MLAPDPLTAQQQMQRQVNAATAITDYCQALITLLPAYSSLIKSTDLSALVASATQHASVWTSGLCMECTEVVPDLFVGFDGTYERAQVHMLEDERALQQSPGDTQAREDLVGRLSSLVAALEPRGEKVASLVRSVGDLQTTLQGDHTASAAIIQRLSGTSEQGMIVTQAQAELGLDFLSSRTLSPCTAIVEIDAQVAVKLDGGPAAGTEVIPAVLLDALLSSLRTQNESATQALSALSDTWHVVTGQYGSTITALEQAQGAGVGEILQELDIQQAGRVWRQLARFAQSIVPAVTPSQP